MDVMQFDSMLQGVADAFGRAISDATKSQYFGVLGSMGEAQWQDTCDAAKRECEQFPRISEMIKISSRYNPPAQTFDRTEYTISCVCKCRNHWAWMNETAFLSQKSWKCWECSTHYETSFLKRFRRGCLIDLTGDDEKVGLKIAPMKVVEMLEKELLF